MKRTIGRNLLFLTIALLMIGGSLFGARLLFVQAYMQERVTLEEQTSPLLPQAQEERAAEDSQPLSLSVGLQVRNRPAAEALLAAMTDPRSPYYKRYLTPQQFKHHFAPADTQVQQVMTFLREQGLTIDGVNGNNLVVNAHGTVAQVERAFQVQIKTYRLGERVFYANDSPPSMPRAVRELITSIGGLDDAAQYQPRVSASSQIEEESTQTQQAQPVGLSPQDMAKAYNVAPLHENAIQGQQQTIALFALDGYREKDIQHYFQHYNLPTPTIERILIDGDTGEAGPGAIETTLDIEMIGSIAPQSKILVYEGPNTIQGVTNIYSKIVNDNATKLVSISWGLCESNMGEAQLQTLNTLFLQGSLQGMTFFAASGDAGAYDCHDNNLAVDSPASDPNVVAVGGTSLQRDQNGEYNSEQVWANPDDNLHGPRGAGSGGGLSAYFQRPTWQNGPGVINQYSNGKRQVPDVAAFADFNPGFSVYCTVKEAACPSNGWMKVGGTSAGAPFWAASMLLVNQHLKANNLNTPGHLNPVLYQLFTNPQPYPSFHDITSGDNLYYPATQGYDLATGLGSPNVYNIARNLAASITPNPTPSATPLPIPTVTPTPTPTPTPPAALIQNSGFEKGTTPWREASSGGFALIDLSNPRKGSWSAFMCGYTTCDDRLWQSFTVPNNYTKVTLTYWWYGSTGGNSTQCVDNLNVRLLTNSGSVIQNVRQICNTQANDIWVQHTIDLTTALSPYKGKPVSLQFRALNGTTQTTAFFVDDVSIAVS